VAQLLALAPSGGAVPGSAGGGELREHGRAVVDGPEGVAEQALLVVEPREVAAEDEVGGNGCHGGAAGPGRDIRIGAGVGGVGAVVGEALGGRAGVAEGTGAVGAAGPGDGGVAGPGGRVHDGGSIGPEEGDRVARAEPESEECLLDHEV